MKTNVYNRGQALDMLHPNKLGKPTSQKSKTRAKAASAAWLVSALLVLSAIPLAAGVYRLTQLAGGAEITPANARFFASPLPVVLHIVSAAFYAILGAFQFATGLRQRWPGWHRTAGRLLVLCGLLVGFSGLWMTLFYPRPAGTGELLFAFRLLFGAAMVVSIVLGFIAIRRRDVISHRAWMMRAYAIGLGAGTQVLTQGAGAMIFGPPDAFSNALLMGAGWVINLAVAEWVIRKRRALPARPEPTLAMRGAFASLALAMLLSSLGTSIANVALPTLAQAFGASFQAVQWIVLAYLLATTTLLVSVGRIGDIIGRRRLLLVGICLFILASALCGFAPTLWLLVIARAVQGLGAAIMMALTLAFVGEMVPKEKTGSAMGILGTMSAMGTALGPSLGGILIAGVGWRAIFFINIPLGIVAILLAYRYLPSERQETTAVPADFDKLGTLLLALTLGAYALAMTIGRGSFGPLNVVLLLAALCGIGLFLFAEAKATSALVRLEMFRDPVLSAGLAMSALVSTVMMATLVVGPFYLARALGCGAALVGLVMSIGPLVVALTGVHAGRMVDRLGAGRMTSLGLIGMVAGSLMLAMIPAAWGLPGYIVPIVVITLGYALFQTANNTAVMKDVRPDQRGVVSGMLNLARNLGLITGASVMGALFAFASATSDMAAARPEAIATGMQTTFAVAALLIIVALVLATKSQSRAMRVLSPGDAT